MDKIFGFIGCGNMGGAIAEAVSKTNVHKKIMLSDSYALKTKQLAEKISGEVSDNLSIAKSADVIFLGIKPQMLEQVIAEIKNTVSKRENVLIVSMAAGVEIRKIENYFGCDISLIRIMPNTPVAIGEGMVLYSANTNVSKEQLDIFLSSMKLSGKLDNICENQIDAASALSGCGPAFVYMFIEALADGGVSCGLPRDKALTYATQTLIGSSKLLATSQKHPGELKDAVCSPGGSTIMGVKALENGCMRGSVINAVNDAFSRTKELGK